MSSPGSGDTIATISSAGAADVDAAVTSARAAQRDWAAQPYLARAAVMLRAATLLQEGPGRLAELLVSEAGSGRGKAAFETQLVTSELQECAALAAQYGEMLRSTKPRLSRARRVPLGVVGVIAPFDFPAILAMRSVSPALGQRGDPQGGPADLRLRWPSPVGWRSPRSSRRRACPGAPARAARWR